jgi:hypothetical protein
MALPACRLAEQWLHSTGPGSNRLLPEAFVESPDSFASRPNMQRYLSTRRANEKRLVCSELRAETEAGCVQFLRPTGRICPTVNTVAVAKSWKSSVLKDLRGIAY